MTIADEMASLLRFKIHKPSYRYQVGDTVYISLDAPVEHGDYVLEKNSLVIKKFDEAENIDYLGRVMWHYVPEQNLYPRCECCHQVMNA